jgi:hypothetical protein
VLLHGRPVQQPLTPIQTGPTGQITPIWRLPSDAQIACYYVLRKKKTDLSKNLRFDENIF